MTPSHSAVGRALSWNAVDLFTRNGLNFLVLVVLARILSPADFGLVAMLNLFVAVAALLINSGFSQALIQRQQTTPADESTVFYFTLAMGAVIALLLCAASPMIAAFYNQPILQAMTCWMALNLFLNTLGTIHTTLLTKELDFKTLAKSSAIASLVSGGVAILMALRGWGVWSLVGRVLTDTVFTVIVLWVLHSWRPQRVFSTDSLRSFFNFGGFLLWTGFLNTIYTNLYGMLIGKLHSAQDVGYYNQARRLEQLPITIITSIVSRVAFQVFAAAAEDKEKLAQGLGKATTSVMFVTVPIMAWVMVMAEEIISVLLGEKWLSAVPVLELLSISGMILPLQMLNLNVLKAQGHSALNARIQIIKLSIAIPLLVLTSPFGIVAVAYGQVATSVLVFFVNTYYTGIFVNYGWRSQLRDVSPYLGAAALMMLAIWAMKTVFGLPVLFEVLVSVVLGGGIYLLVCILARVKAIDTFLSAVVKRSHANG